MVLEKGKFMLSVIPLVVAAIIIVGASFASYHAGEDAAEVKYLAQLTRANEKFKEREDATSQQLQSMGQELAEAKNQKQIVTEIKYKTLYKERIKYVESHPNINIDVPSIWVQYDNAGFSDGQMPAIESTSGINGVPTTIKINTVKRIPSNR